MCGHFTLQLRYHYANGNCLTKISIFIFNHMLTRCLIRIFHKKTGYVLGFIIFPDDLHMQFVLLVIGACLMKGISNFWTVCLTGNTELSVAISILNALLSSGEFNMFMPKKCIFTTKVN